MRLAPTKKLHRGAFTLVELLVVIGIIALLVALTTGTVMKVLARGPELQTRNDIHQLSSAIGTFKQKFGVDTPPSTIRLGFMPNTTYYPNMTNTAADGGLDADSIAYIKRMFPRCYDSWV